MTSTDFQNNAQEQLFLGDKEPTEQGLTSTFRCFSSDRLIGNLTILFKQISVLGTVVSSRLDGLAPGW